ncbi:MAG: pyridoxamine 5'-phosphate oxidase [Neisseriaceae bacterium]|nr:MAG: pyridoxamine 5'-phosphate oxidase [Neisseriaceae bacterium]
MKVSLYNVRQEYAKEKLSVAECANDPFSQFKHWLNQAIQSKVREATAMNLATVDEDDKPSARIVLLKELNNQGFVFFSNYNSRKGQCMKHNHNVALTFFWPELERQVRVEGHIELLDPKASDEYFASRPYKSQIGAWASRQSKVLSSKASLLTSFALVRAKNPNRVKRPSFWGGFLVIPNRVEFWQGRPSRLHDRVEYLLYDGKWKKHRLYP